LKKLTYSYSPRRKTAWVISQSMPRPAD